MIKINTMQKRILLTVVIIGLMAVKGFGQYPTTYGSGSLEMMFQFADVTNLDEINNVNVTERSVLRWAPFFNFQVLFNVDFTKFLGIYAGGGIRNVGFIRDDYNLPNDRFKHRSYNFAVPLGLKLGNLEKFFIFGGYNFEFPFAYKEKQFTSNSKIRFVEWFSNRTPKVMEAVTAGIRFPGGATVTFNYYLNNFFNQEFSYLDTDGKTVMPYQNLTSNVFQISLSFNMFKNPNTYFGDD
jgi:hypothetical protein